MKAKTYLETYEHLYRQAQRLTEQISRLEAQATSIGAIRYDQDRVISSPGDKMSEIVAHKVQLQTVLMETIREMTVLKRDYLELFSRLVNRDREIAKLTWLDFEGTVFISQKLHCSRRTVFRRQKAIIMIVQEMIDR